MNYSKILSFFFLHYLYFLVIAGILFLTGILFLKAIKKYFQVSSPFAYYYLSFFSGALILVTIYAIVITGFKTILVGFLLSGIFLLYPIIISKVKGCYIYLPPYLTAPPKFDFRIIINLFAISFFAYGLEACFLFKEGSFFHVLPHHDIIVYGHISKTLSLAGQENTFTVANLLKMDSDGMSPYHYFELWLNAATSDLFSISTVVSLQFITYPILYFISILGLLSLAEQIMPLNTFRKICAIFLLLAGGLYFIFYENIPIIDSSFIYVANPVCSIYRKLISFYPFVILFLLFFLKKRFYIAFTILMCIPIVSISASFAIYGGIILFLILDKFYLKLLLKKTSVGILFNTFLMMGFIATIYIIFGNQYLVEIKTEDIFAFYEKHINRAILTWTHIIAGSLIQVLILYLPCGFLIFIILSNFLKKDTTNKGLLFLTGCMLFSALLSWALLYFFIESIQFFYNFSFVVINLILSYYTFIIIKNYSLVKAQAKIVWIGILATGLLFVGVKIYSVWTDRKLPSSPYSDEYIVKVLAEKSLNTSNGIGICLYGKEYYDTPFSKLPSYNFLGSYLNYSDKFFHTVNLSSFDIPFENDGYINEMRVNSAIGNSIFYRFVTQQRKKGKFKSVEQSQIDFIDKYHISYAILDKNAQYSELLKKRIAKIIVDTKSGEHFALLK